MARAIWWTMWMAVLAGLWCTTAEASEGGPSPRRAYDRATWTAVGGGIASVVGIPLAIGGLAVAIEGPEFSPPGKYEVGMAMYVGGYAAVGSGGALLAGGSLWARQVLVRHGARVSPVPGALATVTWGTTIAMGFILPSFVDVPGAGWIALSSYVATLGLGTVQLVLNHAALKTLPEGALDAPPAVTFSVVPVVTPDRVGMAVALSF